MLKTVIDEMIKNRETMYDELNRAIAELKAGRYENTYNILTDLSDEIALDIINN